MATTEPSFDIETVHGGTFPEPQTSGVDGVNTLEVAHDQAVVTVDISDLAFREPRSPNQLFLMIVNRGGEQQVGDRFRSRESGQPPKLVLRAAESPDEVDESLAPSPAASIAPTL